MPKQEPSGDGPANVSVSGGQGSQVGTGNVQNNYWTPKPLPDPVDLSALDPHIAVGRLQQYPHEQLVDFFAKASPDDVSEIITAFLNADSVKVVATLGDIKRHRTTQLISRAVESAGTASRLAWLTDLPTAAHEIARAAAALRLTDAGPLERFRPAYARKYRNGYVFWTAPRGVRVTVGAIADYCTAMITKEDAPIGDQEAAPSSPFGTDGNRQKFCMGTVYSSRHGVYRVIPDDFYESEGGSGGWLGFPVEEIERNSGFGGRQSFEGGIIYFNTEGTSSKFAVRQDVVDAVTGDQEFCPTSKETITVSFSGTQGTVQHFKFQDKKNTFEAPVYSSEGHGTAAVAWEIRHYYSELGGEKSWLGFPVEQGREDRSSSRGIQNFESGSIYWQLGMPPFAISTAVVELVGLDQNLYGRLGAPISEEQPIGVNESDRVQLFRNGVVTQWGGKREIWLRPGERAVEQPMPVAPEPASRVPVAGDPAPRPFRAPRPSIRAARPSGKD
jgi:hypothetical protein